jgi:hypothetical protein
MDWETVPPLWASEISHEEWPIYEKVLSTMEESDVQFALGGAFALATYTGHLRDTKDLDIYVLPSKREKMVEILGNCGLEDLYKRQPYDRGWIYRGCTGDTIVDVIWGMPNQRASADQLWLARGPVLPIRGHRLRIIPVEELLWGKMYVMQRERCDWPDVLNLIYHAGSVLDWEYLLGRVGDDAPVLSAVLTLFSWLCPARADGLPGWLWKRLKIRKVSGNCGTRSFLLDTRPWFGPDISGARPNTGER